jgi:PBSX family phage terminase large subunit
MTVAPAKVVKAAPGTRFELRGANRALIGAREHEVILSGPADTGKSFAACIKAHLYCIRKPGCQGAIVRKTSVSLTGTILKTFSKVIEGQKVHPFGGETPSRFIYPNGSCIWVGGMDNPNRILSSERDFIYVCQAEELTLNDWEILGTRCTGRGAVVKYPQLFGDCNPGGSRHWIRERSKSGLLRLLAAVHRDNPTLYDKAGKPTGDGIRRLAALDNLTGVRRKRLRDGIWATAEGAVYDTFDAAVHVQVRPESEMKRWLLALDEGYTNPAVILLVGEDSDGRQHITREFYRRGILQSVVVSQAKAWHLEKGCDMAAVDESAAGLIADLQSVGVNAYGGKGRVIDGISVIQNRLDVCSDGRPRLTVDPECINVINEFESYIWAPDKPKDTPIKENDHALDAIRYLQDVCGRSLGGFSTVEHRRERLESEESEGTHARVGSRGALF